MTTKTKGRNGGDRPTRKTSDSRNHTRSDPLIGWLNLAKPSRNRQQMRGWQRGAIKAKFKVMIVRLALWGLIPAGFATWLIQRAGLKHA